MSQDEMMAKATLIQTKYTDELMRKKHVMGVGIGIGQKGGISTGSICLVVMVDQKVPLAELDAQDQVPEQLEGIELDVQEIGIPQAFGTV